MTQRPDRDPNAYEGYQGSNPQQPYNTYTPDEMPQSAYPHDGPAQTSYQEQPGQQGYYQQPGQQDYNQQSGQQQYYQQPGQQQQYYQQSYGYQPPFGQYSSAYDASPFEMSSMGLKARTAGVLSYLFGWVSGLIFLFLERGNRFVRFHAAQSIILFGVLMIARIIADALPFGGFLEAGLGIVMIVSWIFMMVQAGKGRYYKLPIIGDYAEKLADRVRA